MTKTMATLKPQLEKLNKKYANNKELLAKEQIKLYKETGYNPLGCLFNFIPQMIILIVIIQVIRVVTTENSYEGIYPFVESWINGDMKDFVIDTRFYLWDLGKNYMTIAGEYGYLASQGIAYLILALLVGFVQFISSKFMQAMQNADTKENKKKVNKDEPMAPEEMQKQMMKSMTTIFPLLTIYITLTVPSVLGIYWFVQSLMLVVQYYFIDKKKTIETFKSLNPFIKK